MKPYFEHKGVVSYNADCRDALPLLSEGSADSIVTDPPYELGFMGKGWDRSGIAYDVSVWRECLRVLKPGGHLLAFGGSRTYHRLACAIEDAGFEIRDQIQWIYGSGFPKSLDVSKAIDRHQRRDYVLAAIDLGLNVPGNSLHDWTKAEHSPGDAWWEKFKSHLDPQQWLAIERRVVGEKRKGQTSIFGNGKGAALVSEAATDAAKQWEGWGTALKPSHEPIVLARKPLIGTVAENVLQHGTGGLNIDGCRIETGDDLNGGAYSGDERRRDNYSPSDLLATTSLTRLNRGIGEYTQPVGRWPSNVCHDGSGEVLAGFPETASAGEYRDPLGAKEGGNGMFAGGRVSNAYANELGSAARFFYCAKASKKDRGEGNNHPTVKPTELMRYLCRLVTPPGGVVLDPFGGSGSTAKAAILEGFNCILIEKETDYCEVSAARIKRAQGVARDIPKRAKQYAPTPLFEAVA